MSTYKNKDPEVKVAADKFPKFVSAKTFRHVLWILTYFADMFSCLRQCVTFKTQGPQVKVTDQTVNIFLLQLQCVFELKCLPVGDYVTKTRLRVQRSRSKMRTTYNLNNCDKLLLK